MKPLIVAATKFEILETIPYLEDKQIPYLITGVGMTATAFALGKALALNNYSSIINVGIAGAFDKSIPLGTVLDIKSDSFYELGAEDNDLFISLDELGFGKNTYHANNEIKDCHLSSYKAITVNRVHGNINSIEKVKKFTTDIAIESMEGAAVFYACEMHNIKCSQIRAVSNYVEKRDKSTWKIELAIKNLNDWLKDFISKNY